MPGESAEHDAPGIRRPRRRQNRNELGKLIAPDDLGLLQVPEEQRVALRVLAAERRHAARAHVDPGLEKVEGFELLAALTLHHGPPAPPGPAAPRGEVLRVDGRVAARWRKEQE